jgi:hypothetical protein
MADLFLQLSKRDRRDALEVAAAASGRPAHLLEKDVWVVWALETLFGSTFSGELVFKGGSSLSKAFNAIRRFSEDVDLTYDIRSIVPDLIGDGGSVPPSRSQEKKWTREIRKRLPKWLTDEVLALLRAALTDASLPANARVEGENIFIGYEAMSSGSGYVKPHVLLEFGARSTGEPSAIMPVTCDAAEYLSDLVFPAASPKVMRAERTFWEKATAIHVYCLKGEFRGSLGFARHWYDLTRLDSAGFAKSAFRDRDLARAVARHKTMFFAEKDSTGTIIDYHRAVTGNLALVPVEGALDDLAQDYGKMVDDGLFFDDAKSFEVIMDHCRDIERQANMTDAGR